MGKAYKTGLLIAMLATGLLGCEQIKAAMESEKSPRERAANLVTTGRKALEAGDLAGAEQSFRAATSIVPDAEDAVFGLIEVYTRRGDLSRAVLELKQAGLMLPGDPRPRVLRGDLLMKQDRFLSAAKAYGEAFEADRTRTELGGKQALALALARRNTPALERAEMILGVDPSDPHAKAAKGLVIGSRGQKDEGQALLTEAAGSPEDGPGIALGVWYLQQGNPQAAVAAFRGAVDKGNDVRAHRGLARALIASGQGMEAAEILEPLVNRMPDDSTLLGAYARAMVAEGSYQKALDSATKAARMDPKLAVAWIARGEAQEAMGQPDAAAKSYEQASINEPTPEVFRKMASIYKSQNRVTDAAAALERLVDLAPDDLQAKLELARAFGEMPGSEYKGLELVEQVLAVDKYDGDALELKAELLPKAKKPRTGGSGGRRNTFQVIRGK